MKSDPLTFIGKAALIIFIVFLGMAWAQEARSGEMTKQQQELWKLVIEQWDITVKGTSETALKNYREDGSFWPSWYRKPLDLKLFAKGMSVYRLSSYKLTPMAIQVYGDMAIIQYRYTCVGVYGRTYKGRAMSVRKKENGVWQAIASMDGRSLWGDD